MFEAWNANPIANYVIEIGVNFVLGDGIHVRANNKKVQKVIDGFWNDPDNRMDHRIYDLCQEPSLYGEIFIRFFVNDFNGDVKIVTIDPSIDRPDRERPRNIEHEIRMPPPAHRTIGHHPWASLRDAPHPRPVGARSSRPTTTASG